MCHMMLKRASVTHHFLLKSACVSLHSLAFVHALMAALYVMFPMMLKSASACHETPQGGTRRRHYLAAAPRLDHSSYEPLCSRKLSCAYAVVGRRGLQRSVGGQDREVPAAR